MTIHTSRFGGWWRSNHGRTRLLLVLRRRPGQVGCRLLLFWSRRRFVGYRTGGRLALSADQCDWLTDRHSIALRHEYLLQDSGRIRLEFDNRLVRLDLGYGLAHLHVGTFRLEPADDRPLSHVVAHLGHRKFGSQSAPPTRFVTSVISFGPAMNGPCSTGRCFNVGEPNVYGQRLVTTILIPRKHLLPVPLMSPSTSLSEESESDTIHCSVSDRTCFDEFSEGSRQVGTHSM